MKPQPHLPVLFSKEYHDYASVAIEAHGLQMYGTKPYAYHLAQVENILVENGFNEHHYRASAWLHDVLEDTDIPIDQVNVLFGVEVARLVWACTGVGANRAQRLDCILERLKHVPEAAPVKCADRYANVAYGVATKNKEKMQMYLAEWPKFKATVEPLMTKTHHKRAPMLFIDLEDLHKRAEDLVNTMNKEKKEKEDAERTEQQNSSEE